MSIPIQVSPATNDLTLSIDQTLAEVVKVTIPKFGVVPKVDVYFLADTTGSMKPAIAAVKSGIVDVMTRIQGLGSDVWFGVGDYKDFPAPVTDEHPYAFKHQCSLSSQYYPSQSDRFLDDLSRPGHSRSPILWTRSGSRTTRWQDRLAW